MRAIDLLDWHPRIAHPADQRQGELFHDASGGSSGDRLPAATMPEWIARAEAAALRAEANARRAWGLRRRLTALLSDQRTEAAAMSAMSPYDGMKLAAAIRLLLRPGRGRRYGRHRGGGQQWGLRRRLRWALGRRR